NARAWVHVRARGETVAVAAHTAVLTPLANLPPRIPTASYEEVLKQRPLVFETMHDALLFEAHNEMSFYTAGDTRCCLPKGATRAWLLDRPERRLRLRRGDVLIFEERIGPVTGVPAAADPARRHAVP